LFAIRRALPCPRSPGCAFCIANRKRTRNFVGHRYYVSPSRARSWVEYIMKRDTPVKSSKKGDVQCPDQEFGGPYPSVSNYLCDAWWDDGKPREPSSLSIKMDETYVHVGLMDHAQRRSVYCTAPSLVQALTMLEDLLASGKVSWRTWKGGK